MVIEAAPEATEKEVSEAELMEFINKKRNTLEDYRAGHPPISKSLLRVLEDELKELETALAEADANIKKVLLDRCAEKV